MFKVEPSPVKVSDACLRIDDEEITGAFGEPMKGTTWYACTSPSEDPTMTCFMAPAWMGFEEEKWVCVSGLVSELLAAPTFSEDSY